MSSPFRCRRLAQPLPGAPEPGSSRTRRDAEDRGGLLTAHAFKADQQNDPAVPFRQSCNCALEIEQVETGVRIGGRDPEGCAGRGNTVLFAPRPTDLVDMQIVQDREEPGPQIAAGLPEVRL